MNTEEIRRTLQNVKHFDDVYSIDTLPARPRGILVCNFDPSHRSGSHWVCICVDEGNYFDTFGRAPPKTLKHYMNAWCEHIGHTTLVRYRASSAVFVDTIVFIFACLKVEDSL